MRAVWAVVIGLVGTLAGAVIGDMVNEGVRVRLERLPAAIIRLAGRCLPAGVRREWTTEWLAELVVILEGTEALPITRLVRATRFATSLLLRGAPAIGRDLTRTSDGSTGIGDALVASPRLIEPFRMGRRRRVLPHPSVLHHSSTRSLFLRLADAGFFEFRLSSPMLEETRRMILADRPRLKSRDVNQIFSAIWDAYSEAQLRDSDVLQASSQLQRIPPRSKDYFTLITAVAGKVDSIVAIDTTHISIDTCGDLGIAVVSLDTLLCSCWIHDEYSVLQVFIAEAVERAYSPSKMVQNLVIPLRPYAPEFVQMLGVYRPHMI